jgi:hypothetical protein
VGSTGPSIGAVNPREPRVDENVTHS